MFDYFFKLVLSWRRGSVILRGNKLRQKKLYHKSGSDTLYVFLPGWRVTTDFSDRLRHQIETSSSSSMVYEITSEILSSDVEKTRKSFVRLNRLIRRDIRKVRRKYDYKDIHLVGYSLGTVSAMMVANNNKHISGVTLVCPADCLAEAMWESIMTRFLRRAMERKGVTIEYLKKKWKMLAPKNNLGSLRGKRIEIFLSEADRVVPYSYGSKLVKTMKRKGIKPLLRKNVSLGHYATILKFFYLSRFKKGAFV